MSVRRVFVVGSDTGIGKTVVAGLLATCWEARYWKPVQAGTPTDSDTVAAWIGQERIVPERYRLAQPLSPHLAARLEGLEMHLGDFALPPEEEPLVVEGAGGLFTPLNGEHLIIDLVAHLGLPAVLVTRDRLGAINQAVGALHALRARAIPVLGVVLTGHHDEENARAIAHHGGAPVLGRVPWLDQLHPEVFRTVCGGFTFPS